jgi:hypothetical protein
MGDFVRKLSGLLWFTHNNIKRDLRDICQSRPTLFSLSHLSLYCCGGPVFCRVGVSLAQRLGWLHCRTIYHERSNQVLDATGIEPVEHMQMLQGIEVAVREGVYGGYPWILPIAGLVPMSWCVRNHALVCGLACCTGSLACKSAIRVGGVDHCLVVRLWIIAWWRGCGSFFGGEVVDHCLVARLWIIVWGGWWI